MCSNGTLFTCFWLVTLFFTVILYSGMGITVAIIFISPMLALTLISFRNCIRAFSPRSEMASNIHSEREFSHEAFTIVGGFIATLAIFSTMDDYDRALTRMRDILLHRPVASSDALTLCALFLLGAAGWFTLRRFCLNLPPLRMVLMMSLLFIGMGVCIVYLNQIFGGFSAKGIYELMYWQRVSHEDLYVAYLLLPPLNFIVIGLTVTKRTLDAYSGYDPVKYHNPLLNRLSAMLGDSRRWPAFALLLMLPVLALTICVLLVFGQQPDSALRAFTETSDWALSERVSPPIVDYQGHYLCTIALCGHAALVKPLRCGMRGGRKIIINRQLLIANAFEQLLEEKLPKLHRPIRRYYDAYGYPLSKHIVTAWRADFIYLLMKPLEYIFLAILYFFDLKPENRIARQYLP